MTNENRMMRDEKHQEERHSSSATRLTFCAKSDLRIDEPIAYTLAGRKLTTGSLKRSREGLSRQKCLKCERNLENVRRRQGFDPL